jgi:2-hydroxychromene-2-carboxylate isomerase
VALTLFTDLNCPFCYATEQRLERLGVSDRITWRGVEHEPELPVPMARDDAEIAAELAAEVASVQSRAPEVAIAVPPGKANTAPGLLAAAAALRTDADKGAAFRQAVYRAFWRDGKDVSDPQVLAELAQAVGLPAPRTRPEDALTVALLAPRVGAVAAARRAAAPARRRRDRLRAEGHRDAGALRQRGNALTSSSGAPRTTQVGWANHLRTHRRPPTSAGRASAPRCCW